jgi:putative transposase
MSRIARVVGAGYFHHIVQRGNNKQTIFFDDADKQIYLELLKKYSKECECHVYAYCLMNNHVHLLLIPQQENSLAKAMQKLSLRYTQIFNEKYDKSGRLWECRFHSALVDKDEYLLTVCRYIERNPVRANMVNHPKQYKWSSYRINAEGEKHNFVESVWGNDEDRRAYYQFVNQPDDDEEMFKVRKYTANGQPIGTNKFLGQLNRELGLSIKPRL